MFASIGGGGGGSVLLGIVALALLLSAVPGHVHGLTVGYPSIRNDVIQMNFSAPGTGFQLAGLSVVGGGGGPNLITAEATPTPLWTLVAVDRVGMFTVDAHAGTQSFTATGPASVTLVWKNVPVRMLTMVDVQLVCTLAPGAPAAEWVVSVVNSKPSANVGAWQLTLAVGGLPGNSDDVIFYPSGFGVEIPVNAAGATQAHVYPASDATMPFLAVGGSAANANQGVYVGAHDPRAYTKNVWTRAVSSTAMSIPHQSGVYLPNVPWSLDALPQPSESNPLHRGLSAQAMFVPLPHLHGTPSPSTNTSTSTSARTTVTLGYDILLPNAGLQFANITLPIVLAVGITQQAPTWYGAATIYRAWALKNAPWLSAGPVKGRPDIPKWFHENGLWVNSGWQCYDVFNETQGDPTVVGKGDVCVE